MPHAILRRQVVAKDVGSISFAVGATRSALKSRPTSLVVSPYISPAPDEAELKKSNAPLGLAMIEEPLWSALNTRCPLMPHRILRRETLEIPIH